MAYLRHNRVSRQIRGTFGPEFELNELYAGHPWQASEKEPEPSAWYDGFMVKKILRQQRKHGSWCEVCSGVARRRRPPASVMTRARPHRPARPTRVLLSAGKRRSTNPRVARGRDTSSA